MVKKEIRITFVPSDLDDWKEYNEKVNAKEYSNTKDGAIIMLVILAVALPLVWYSPYFTFSILAILFVLVIIFWIHEWIKHVKEEKTKRMGGLDTKKRTKRLLQIGI